MPSQAARHLDANTIDRGRIVTVPTYEPTGTVLEWLELARSTRDRADLTRDEAEADRLEGLASDFEHLAAKQAGLVAL